MNCRGIERRERRVKSCVYCYFVFALVNMPIFAPRISAPKQEKFVVCIHLDNENDRKENLYNYLTVQ